MLIHDRNVAWLYPTNDSLHDADVLSVDGDSGVIHKKGHTKDKLVVVVQGLPSKAKRLID